VAVIVLDAGVLIGYLDRDDSHHARSVTVMNESAGEELHLPASAYAEVMVGAYRAGLADGVRERIDELELLIEYLRLRSHSGLDDRLHDPVGWRERQLIKTRQPEAI